MSTTTDFATQLLLTLQTADDNYIANVLMALDHGLPLFKARKDAEKTVEKEAEKEKEKEKPAVKAKKAVKKPEADLPVADNGAPDASEYRIDQDSIDTSTCVGRQVMDMDKRWSTAIIRERQCGKEIAEDGLCKGCAARAEKYDDKPGSWLGRVTEEPFDWCHMLGTEWAEKKKPVFNSASAPVSENGSDQEMEVKEKKKPGRAPKMTEEEKEAAKAAKEAEKAAAKAAKEAEKAAEKAKKEAEKEAKKAEKAAEKAKKTEKTEKTPKTKPKNVEAKVVSTEEPVNVVSTLEYIDDVLYKVVNGNVYNYNELTEEAGKFVGRRTDQGTIDTEADEVTVEESE